MKKHNFYRYRRNFEIQLNEATGDSYDEKVFFTP